MLRNADNLEYRDGTLVGVKCRGCGVPIRKMVPDDSNREIKRVGNQTIVYERMVLACLPNYREVLMTFADGSAHVACMCENCSKTYDNKQMQQHHDEDMAEMGVKQKREFDVVAKVANHISAV